MKREREEKDRQSLMESFGSGDCLPVRKEVMVEANLKSDAVGRVELSPRHQEQPKPQ